MKFIDEISFGIASGNGGSGCVSFRRERFIPKGGPDGGDGGRGGALHLVASKRRNTLVDYRWNKVYRAGNGEPGRGRQQYGKSGTDLELLVPVGTVVYNEETGELLADLAEEGARWSIEGGRGGNGNMHYKSSTRQTPLYAQPGEPGTEFRVRCELKLLADVGLLGFPNAGKSTLISRLSAAKPRVADYPFTTLVPSLGVVEIDLGQSYVIADIPGLIEGASEGVGLGHRFLRHVERCSTFAHLVSANPYEDLDVVERYHAIQKELARYSPELAERPQELLLTQTDLIDAEEQQRLVTALQKASGCPVHAISSATGDGLADLKHRLWHRLHPE